MMTGSSHCFSLVGLPCSGKTTFGRILSQHLSCDWIDLDEEIERRTGMSVKEYIASVGTPAFRAFETEVLQDVLSTYNNIGKTLVLSTGGGAVLSEANRKALRSGSTVVYLNRPLPAIYADLSPEELAKRPLLQASSLEKLYDERHCFYEEVADITLTDPFSPSALEIFDKSVIFD